ncbi:MAG TPA: FAD/NAD(P)-binding protein [Candidatus Sulfotelmatobacter sp.]
MIVRFYEGMANNMTEHFNIAIVGGGFSGTMLAVQLLRRDSGIRVAVIDKSSAPGLGLAYSTEDPNHLLNVPAENMSAFPDEPDHLVRWARSNYDPSFRPESFLPRMVYGQYLVSLLQAATARSGNRLSWLRDQAVSLTPQGEHFILQLNEGQQLQAKAVVLALGNSAPPDLNIPGLSGSASRYAATAWSPNALGGLSGHEDILLIGSGLTSVDMAISLHGRGFKGKIYIVSRRGLLPQTHRESESRPDFSAEDFPQTARSLLRLIRNKTRSAKKEGGNWRPVIDAIRPVTSQIWSSLPPHERTRFLRHLRPYWEVHRHRVAPGIGAKLAAMIEKGQVEVHGGRLVKYSENDAFAEVTFRERGSGQLRELRVNRVINCTGSEGDCRRINDPLLNSLIAQQLARPDPLFLGLDVDANGVLFGSNGIASSALYAIGPARKGRLWESVAVPELRVQAAQLAEHLVHRTVDAERAVAGGRGPDFARKKDSQNTPRKEREEEEEDYVFGNSK